ncbi:hypothetical protein TNCV_1450531 [Trichonephila clavipes]|nr:hypothetical protein TNCV_1450531 [Trichonephila clavipes]
MFFLSSDIVVKNCHGKGSLYQDVVAQQKSVDEKVLDVVRAAELLVTPSPRVFLHPPSSLKKKKTTTIVLSKHTVHPSPAEEIYQACFLDEPFLLLSKVAEIVFNSKSIPESQRGVRLITPLSRHERYRFLLVLTDHFTKWSELIPVRKDSAQAIANALFENYISRYGAPISLISDNGPQFISENFEHLCHRLDIKHIKKVIYRPQKNLTGRVNRTLVHIIACFEEENHENWNRFLHEFAFALSTSDNETTSKTPAELFLGRNINTSFSKLINVTEDAEYVGRNIEKLFVEARQNMRKQHKTWGK